MAVDDFFPDTARIFTVAELTRSIRSLLETRFAGVWVRGEISNYKKHPSGHQYFTLKDQRSGIACVIFRNTLPPFPSPLADGMQVQVYGSVTVFEARGQYQLNVQILQSRGLGLLQAKFEALKRKLEAEGLFDPARKRALPKFPRRIGIVTSSSGAAIQDILNILQRRAPGVEVLINPVRVQGTGASLEIATAIRELSAPNEVWKTLDVLIVARGGGSIEDLWEFNEEIVARAISQATIPVVSAVGHEVDFTIADFVADLRAPTPSAAAELIVPDSVELDRRLQELAVCLSRCLRSFLSQSRARLSFLSERTLVRELVNRMNAVRQQLDLAKEALLRRVDQRLTIARAALFSGSQQLKAHHPGRKLMALRSTLTELQRRGTALPPRFLADAEQRFRRLDGILRVLGPEATLQRGYSITTDLNGKIIRSTTGLSPKSDILTLLSEGKKIRSSIRKLN